MNLSPSGACVRVNALVQEGQSVELYLRLCPDGMAMPVKGQVIWTREDPDEKGLAIGVGFEDVDSALQSLIRDYVEIAESSLLRFLSEFPLFCEFSREDCRRLIYVITRRTLEKEQTLYKQDTTDTELQGLFVVQSGLLAIYRGRRRTKASQLAVVSPGQVFGEATLICDQPHSASVVAVNDTELLQIQKKGFQQLREEDAYLAMKIYDVVSRVLIQRLGRTTKRLFSPVSVR